MKKLMLITGMLALVMSACQESDGNPLKAKERQDIVLSRTEEEMVDESNDFAFRFFHQVNASEQKEPNWMVSPLSASMALGMMTNGADGNTLEEMKATLGFSVASLEEMNAYYQKLAGALLNLDNTTQLGIANSIWINDEFEVNAPFADVNQKMYHAQVERRNFSLTSTIDDINRWCAEKTNNCIPEVIKEISPEASMFLINALYFKGAWTKKFNKKDTREETFTNADGSKSQVMMMHQTGTFPYLHNNYEQYAAIALPYGNEAFSMVILLPNEGVDLAECLSVFNKEDWKIWNRGGGGVTMDIQLPRFKMEYEKNLTEDMKALGIKDAFSDKADFSAISADPLFFSLIKQNTFIEVNEEGTEAAAVTVTGMAFGTMKPSDPPAFHVNRPFAYIIKENSTGTILFMGKVTQL